MTDLPSDPVRKLPRDVEVVASDDAEGRRLYSLRFIEWPQERPIVSHDLALLTKQVWGIHRSHRPSTIDDARLQQVVHAPPLSPARLLCELLTLQCGRWIINSTIELINRATGKFHDGDPATKAAASILKRHRDRSWLTLCVLEGIFERYCQLLWIEDRRAA